ncbi:MAG: helix-turn-helix transcriptional regulator [Cyclobacteriaceae bacterium]
MSSTLAIKNMVCDRCIEAVRQILIDLDVRFDIVGLGTVKVEQELTKAKREKLSQCLHDRGFELLEDKLSQRISQIKTVIIEQIHQSGNALNVNYSTLIAEKVGRDYTALSKLFSSIEGITIERFILKHKIEKVKELIVYDELTLSEIAHKLNYSSVAHLSSQFKKETGMTPSAFRNLGNSMRRKLDAL